MADLMQRAAPRLLRPDKQTKQTPTRQPVCHQAPRQHQRNAEVQVQCPEGQGPRPGNLGFALELHGRVVAQAAPEVVVVESTSSSSGESDTESHDATTAPAAEAVCARRPCHVAGLGVGCQALEEVPDWEPGFADEFDSEFNHPDKGWDYV